jgi:hypothetical protein
MQKQKFGVTCSSALFMETAPGLPEHEKYCVDVSLPGLSEMHYVTRSSHRMQKHMFGVTCPDAHFIETARARKIVHQCFASGCTGLHYVTRKSHRMQKHMLGIMCPRMLFMKTAPDPPEHENSVSMFRIPDVPECITSPEDPTRCKNTSSA